MAPPGGADVALSSDSDRSPVDAAQRPAASSYRTPTKNVVHAAVPPAVAQQGQHIAASRPSMEWKDADGTDDWAVDRVNEDWLNKVTDALGRRARSIMHTNTHINARVLALVHH